MFFRHLNKIQVKKTSNKNISYSNGISDQKKKIILKNTYKSFKNVFFLCVKDNKFLEFEV